MPDTLHLVDPELRPMLEVWPTIELDAAWLAQIRAGETTVPLPPVAPNDVRQEQRSVAGPAGSPDLNVVIYTPPDEGPFPCLYHIHGGGYISGSAAPLEFVHRPLAEELSCVIVSVDYRLAPETPHPGPIEDCYAGLAWTVGHAEELGIDLTRLGVSGESAGGGLAAALALMVRDRGELKLAFQQLTYPMLDDRTTTAEPHPVAGEFIWTPHNNHFGWKALLGHEPGQAGVSPYAAAARASDLAGLPPTYISTGTLDLFVSEDIEYARRLIEAGVPTELRVYPGSFHGFDLHPTASVARRAREDRATALKGFFRPA